MRLFQALMAKRRRGGGGTELATWSATDKHANISLDATKLIATQAVNTSLVSVRATIGKSTGKYLFEITKGIADAYVYIGLADATMALAAQLGSAVVPSSISVGHRLAAYYANNVTTSGIAPTNVNTAYLIAVDCDLGRGWIAKAGAWAQGDPTTDTSPSFTWTPGTTVYPAASLSNASTPDNTATLNAGQSAFVNSTLAAACVAAGYKEGFGNFAAPVVEYIYGLNGELRGEVVDGVTTLYDVTILDYNPSGGTWATVAGASSTTGYIADGTATVTFNTAAAHPYAVGDKVVVPFKTSSVGGNAMTVTSSTAKLPDGAYTIQTVPTTTSFTATLDAGSAGITAGTGNFDGLTEYELFRYTIPPTTLYVGDTLNISGHIKSIGGGTKTLTVWLNEATNVMTINGSASMVTTATGGTIEAFTGSIVVTEDSFTGVSPLSVLFSPDTDNTHIIFRILRTDANSSVSLEDLTITLVRP